MLCWKRQNDKLLQLMERMEPVEIRTISWSKFERSVELINQKFFALKKMFRKYQGFSLIRVSSERLVE